VILTPHSAGLSKEAAIRMAISTAHNVLAGIDGKLDPSMVSAQRCCEEDGERAGQERIAVRGDHW
jgi:hypothetical protein